MPASCSTNQAPLHIFRQTIIMRLLALILLAPFGIAAIFGAKHDGLDIWLVIGLALCSVTALVWIYGYVFRLEVYGNCLVKKSFFGTKTAAITDVTKIYHKSVQEYVSGLVAGKHIYITVDDGKGKIKLNSDLKGIQNLHDWLIEVEQQFYNNRYHAYCSGGSIDFGALRLHGGNLIYKDKSLPLSQIDKMKVENGNLKVAVAGKMFAFCKIPVGKIANLFTFLRMVDDAMANVESRPVPTTSTRMATQVVSDGMGAASVPLSESREASAGPAAAANAPTICPTCNKIMKKRRATSGPQSGRSFWVCTAYPDCKSVVPAMD